MKRFLFKNKALYNIAFSQSLSRFGDNLEYIALCIICFQLSGSVISIGILSAVSAIPNIIFILVGGAISDKVNKRHLMMLMEFFRFSLILIIPLLNILNLLNNTYIYIIVFIVSTCESFFMPCNNAFIACIVDEEDYLETNALMNSIFQIVSVIGLAVGGIIVNLIGINFTIIIDSITFLISAIFIYFLKDDTSTITNKTSIKSTFKLDTVIKDIKIGLSQIFYKKNLNILFISFIVINMVISPLEPYITYSLKIINENYFNINMGIVFSVLSLGVIIGNLLLVRLSSKFSNYKIVIISLILSIVSMLSICINNISILIISIFILGFISALLRTITISKLMVSVTKEFRARISSCILLAALSLSPLISMLSSFLIQYEQKNLIWFINIIVVIFILIIFKKNKYIFDN